MESFETSTTIDAPAERVWEVLADTSSWPEWDSRVVRVEGELRRGNRIKVVSEVNPKRAYLVKVSERAPERAMREEFSGPLLPLIWRSMPDMNPSFRQFAQGLKQRAEGGA